MSVTFSIIDTPTEDVPCPYCRDFGRKDFDGKCDPYCNGIHTQPLWPEVNFANMNARTVLELMGIQEEYLYGTAKHEKLAELQKRISSAIKWEEIRISLHHVTALENHHRLTRMKEVLDHAEQNGKGICWA